MASTDLANVEPHAWRADTSALNTDSATRHEENVVATDYYEILRIAPQADDETIERVYTTLADRFDPNNPNTGDRETFLRLREAYETLSDPVLRARYNVSRQHKKGGSRFWLRGREFFDGVRGGQNRRLAVLCLLYRKRITTHDMPGLNILDLEGLTGCTREELTSALWYLCEKKWAAVGEFTAYGITVDGFDVVESKVEDRSEFRAIATLRYYDVPAEAEESADGETRIRKKGLPVDIEPARLIEGEVSSADHYEILGIGAQADDEAIERVYSTLASRFHPDNNCTGDANVFPRIREAYETLSDPIRRAQYDAVRQRTKYSGRFRLRGREFFDGIKGEQLRRLAVLCLLYRQAAGESPGLTVLDLEQLTGCTREELGSALWYLREKKWARAGEFTEYSITATGFDVVENKLEDREAARSRTWTAPEATQVSEVVYREGGEPQAVLPSPRNVPVTLQSPILKAIAPENRNPHQIAAVERTNIEARVPSENSENEEVEQVPNLIEEARGLAKQATRLNNGAEPEERNAAQSWAWLYPEDNYAAQPAEPSPSDVPAAPRPPNSQGAAAAGNPEAQGPPGAAPGVSRQATRVENDEKPKERETARSWTWLDAEDNYANELLYPYQAGLSHPVENSPRNVAVTVEPPASQPAAKSQPSEKTVHEPSGIGPVTGPGREAAGAAATAEKRVILSMGGKGGVGKTSVMTGLAEWFEENRIPVTLLDLDIENKARGSLTHFFGGRVPKVNIHTPAGLDAFVDHLAEDAPVILADMGAGAGQITHEWFDKMYPDVAEAGIAFTAVGVVTSDPASVESVLNWAAALQNRVDYVIVENHLAEHADFSYWRETEQAEEFRKRFRPAIIRMDYRLADLENAVRNYGLTLGRVAGRTTLPAELQKASLVMRAQSYRRRMFAEFEKAKELLLP